MERSVVYAAYVKYLNSHFSFRGIEIFQSATWNKKTFTIRITSGQLQRLGYSHLLKYRLVLCIRKRTGDFWQERVYQSNRKFNGSISWILYTLQLLSFMLLIYIFIEAYFNTYYIYCTFK